MTKKLEERVDARPPQSRRHFEIVSLFRTRVLRKENILAYFEASRLRACVAEGCLYGNIRTQLREGDRRSCFIVLAG
jgi:hypothetical protein